MQVWGILKRQWRFWCKEGKGKSNWVTGTLKDWYEVYWRVNNAAAFKHIEIKIYSWAFLWVIALNRSEAQR